MTQANEKEIIEEIPNKLGQIGIWLIQILTGILIALEIYNFLPQKPLVILELNMDAPLQYSIIGTDLNQDYSLEYLKIYPTFDNVESKPTVENATFQYENYNKKVKLLESKIETPKAYIVSRDFLQKEFKDNTFFFRLLSNDHFKFNFLFKEGKEESVPKFTCKVVIKDSLSGQKQDVPCEIVKKDSLSFIAQVNIYGVIIAILAVFWFLFFFKFFKPQSTKTNYEGLGRNKGPSNRNRGGIKRRL